MSYKLLRAVKSPCAPPFQLLLAHLLQVFHRQKVDIQHALHAVGQTRLLALVKLATANRPRHALLPAHLRKRMRVYTIVSFLQTLSQRTRSPADQD